MTMPGGSWSMGAYRYGFNGKENDLETKSQDYGERDYSPLIARFWRTDPLEKNYPYLSTYQFASNNPIKFIDLDGTESADSPVPSPQWKVVMKSARDVPRDATRSAYLIHNKTNNQTQWVIVDQNQNGGYIYSTWDNKKFSTFLNERESSLRYTKTMVKFADNFAKGTLIGAGVIAAAPLAAAPAVGQGLRTAVPKVFNYLKDQFNPFKDGGLFKLNLSGSLSDFSAQMLTGEGNTAERFRNVNWIGVIAEGKLGAFGSAFTGSAFRYSLQNDFEAPIYSKPVEFGVNTFTGTLGNYLGDRSTNWLSGGSEGRLRGFGKVVTEYYGNLMGDLPSSAGANKTNDNLSKKK
jgi:RHS repeat-associated protein